MNYNITPKEIYNILRNDSIIFQIYKAIEEKEIRDGGWAFHNYEHVENVSIISEKILRNLDFEEVNSYYFTDKVFKAIEAFSKKFNLRYNVLLNNKIWNH